MKAGRIPLETGRETAVRYLHRPAAKLVLYLFLLFAVHSVAAGAKEESQPLAGLKQIHAEVKEMGPYPGDDFIRREFFVGEDDDDTNKDVQVVILIQSFEAKEKMTVRVTEMAREPAGSRTSVAKTSKALVCLVAGDRVKILSSDYENELLERLVPDILTAVRNKKRLLKLGNRISLSGSGRPG